MTQTQWKEDTYTEWFTFVLVIILCWIIFPSEKSDEEEKLFK